jgi:hypothetical protein
LLIFFVILLRSFQPYCSDILCSTSWPAVDFCSVPNLPHFINLSILLPYSGSNSYSSWDKCPSKLWTLPTFSELANMSCDDLTSPIAAAATAQVKLRPYDEEEPHIWFRLIEAQFVAAGIKSQKLKYANSLAKPAQASPSGYFGYP